MRSINTVLLSEFLRYGVVGAITALLFVGAIGVISSIAGPGIFVTALCYGVAVCFQYMGHARFTFKRDPANAKQGRRFLVINALGLSLSVLVVNGLGPALSLRPEWSALIVIAILPALNFLLFRYWAFSTPTQNRDQRLSNGA
ncbi:MAG: GtrA family protein [Pseudomonadota bacterium]